MEILVGCIGDWGRVKQSRWHRFVGARRDGLSSGELVLYGLKLVLVVRGRGRWRVRDGKVMMQDALKFHVYLSEDVSKD